ncbi:aminotransferase class I/II-fold pyridoxal phosphate-dependent enzyme [Azohydromonas australica]|uniref:aminotransferase class I/II-fold pyridoxal phosphate-dependent enzyme n=1 Tax=Azohydromonas australica TaxID=364039 RepID=UPI0003FCFAEC|nr:aminotransferase class I/II-fold pyridoxal phosphate-dependent enzyme [Azohydromonas australica]
MNVYRRATRAVHEAHYQDLSDAHCEPIATTSAYVFRSAADAARKFSGSAKGNVYSRFSNPTVSSFEKRLAAMEGAQDGVAFASGMAAIAALGHAWLEAGKNVVVSRDVFGTTLTAFRHYFGKLGVQVRTVDLTKLDAWRRAIDTDTRLVFLESPSNPVQQVGNIRSIAALAHACGALVAVDNTMLTPVFQNPLEHGADVVVHSAGKYIDGQGRCVAGAVLGSERLMADLRGVLRTLGGTLSATNAWMLLKSLETLELRVRGASRSSEQLARWLGAHGRVGRVHYTAMAEHPQRPLILQQQTGHGAVFSFEVGQSQEDAWRFVDALKLVAIATNIGDTRSMVTHPASTTHCRLTAEERRLSGIRDNLVRLSVGLEDPADLMADLDEALSVVSMREPEPEPEEEGCDAGGCLAEEEDGLHVPS